MKIFFVHGVGHADLDQNYYRPWETDVTDQLRSLVLQTDPQYEGLTYDPLFQQYDHGPCHLRSSSGRILELGRGPFGY